MSARGFAAALSIRVEDLFHRRPPFPGRGRGHRFLAGAGEGPPLPGLGVGGHPGHVGREVGADVFEIGEEQAVYSPSFSGLTPMTCPWRVTAASPASADLGEGRFQGLEYPGGELLLEIRDIGRGGTGRFPLGQPVGGPGEGLVLYAGEDGEDPLATA